MNKNRSVVIVRYNDAIDGVLCKVRHFFGIVLRWHRSPLFSLYLSMCVSRSSSFLLAFATLICIEPMFLARLSNNYDCVRILGGRMRYAFNLFIYIFAAVCVFFCFVWCFYFLFFSSSFACCCSFGTLPMIVCAKLKFSFYFFSCLLFLCRQCDQIPCRLKIIASIVCF